MGGGVSGDGEKMAGIGNYVWRKAKVFEDERIFQDRQSVRGVKPWTKEPETRNEPLASKLTGGGKGGGVENIWAGSGWKVVVVVQKAPFSVIKVITRHARKRQTRGHPKD